MGSRLEQTIGAVFIALGAGISSSFFVYMALAVAFIQTGVIKIVFFAPRPEPAVWMLPTLVIGSIAAGIGVAWLVFWLLDKNYTIALRNPESGLKANEMRGF